MPALKIVDDPDLERRLGSSVVEDLRASIQPTGDCLACSQPLGHDRPLRIDANITEVAAVAYTRHASCTPTAVSSNMLFLPPTTYRVGARLLPIETQRGVLLVPWVLVNPACDVFVLSRDHVSGEVLRLLEPFRRAGFTPFSETTFLADTPSTPHVPWQREGDRLALDVLGSDVAIALNEKFFSAADECGGFVLMVDFRATVDDMLQDSAVLAQAIYAEDEALMCWVSTTGVSTTDEPQQ